MRQRNMASHLEFRHIKSIFIQKSKSGKDNKIAGIDARSCRSIIKEKIKVLDIGLIHDWYNNEWGYSARLAEFTEFVGIRLR